MNKGTLDKSLWISHEERVKFYLNHQDHFEIDENHFERIKNQSYWHRKEMNWVSYEHYRNTFIHWYCQHLVHLPAIRKIRVLPFYKHYKNLHGLMNFFMPIDRLGFEFKDTRYPMYFGEMGDTDGIPCIRKSRRSDDRTSVIYNFRTLRLTQPCFIALKQDIPWEEKVDNVIWRGATTGKQQRVQFVENYFEKYDVGFASIKQKPELGHLKRNSVSVKNQLKYKFIVSMEGNDVASNLRWVLSSNSVPIIPKPQWHSWIMEEYLEPKVHYLELNEDLSNLEEILDWAKDNDAQCKEIAENGKKYMSQFLDEKNDLPVQKLLLEEYAKKLTFIPKKS